MAAAYLAPMEGHIVRILSAVYITPNVKRIQVERPKGYTMTPGQATEVSINQPEWRDQRRPFTFTNLPGARHLEFIIKIYEAHDGVTKRIALLHAGDELVLQEPFGAITYKGPGFFLAGGAGITPFIAILRDLHHRKALRGNTLLASYREAADTILDEELGRMLGKHYLKVYTRQHVIGFRERHIDRDTLIVLVEDFDQHFYVCGPPGFVRDMNGLLLSLGAKAESLVFEA